MRPRPRPRSRPARMALAAVAVGIALAAIMLAAWGTRWTIPQARSAQAHYTLRDAWDGSAIPNGALDGPVGLAVAPSGDVYVTDARLRVVRFDAAGAFLGQWGTEGEEAGQFGNPVGIAVGADGAVYVADYEQDRIQKFTADGTFVFAFGGSGSGPGELDAPAGLAVDDAGDVYVADFYNHRLQKWRSDGSFDRVIGRPGRVGAGKLHYPTGVAMVSPRELLAADAYNYQLQWFDTAGQPLRRAGYHLFWIWPRPSGATRGFSVPTGAAVDRHGVIHVADSGNHRIIMLSSRGEYITEWALPDAHPDVYSPQHVAVSPDGATVYATDLAGNRLLVLDAVRAPESTTAR